MNLEELQTARDRERQTDKLQQLRETFYADAGEFIQQLRTERDRAAERADDPFDAPEVNQLTDEINTAEQTVEAIYEKRVGKIVKAASFAAADLPAEAEGMTAEEQELFDTLVGNIKGNRQHVLDVLAGENPESPANQPGESQQESAEERGSVTDETTEQGTETGVSAADLMGTGDEKSQGEPADKEAVPPEGSSHGHPPEQPDPVGDASEQETGTPEPDQTPAKNPPHQGDAVRNDGGKPATVGDEPGQLGGKAEQVQPESPSQPDGPALEGEGKPADRGERSEAIDRRTVRITDDIETFIGSDERDYDLETDDIVTLPESNANLLIERDVAKEL